MIHPIMTLFHYDRQKLEVACQDPRQVGGLLVLQSEHSSPPTNYGLKSFWIVR